MMMMMIIKSQKVRQETFFLDVRLAALKSHLQSKTPPVSLLPQRPLSQTGRGRRQGGYLFEPILR